MKRRNPLALLCLLLTSIAWAGGCGLLDGAEVSDADADVPAPGDTSGNTSGTSGTSSGSDADASPPEDTSPPDQSDTTGTGTENFADPRLSRMHRVSNFCASAATGTSVAEGTPVKWQAQSGPSTVGSGQTIGAGSYRMESGLAALSIIPTATLFFCGDGIREGAEACDPLQNDLTCEDYGWDLGNAQCASDCIADLSSCSFMFTQLDVISANLTCGLRPPQQQRPDSAPRSNITCWPDDSGRAGFKLPDRDDNNTPIATHFKALATFLDPSTGIGHACAITESGETLCSGDNSQNQTRPPSGKRFVTLAAGRHFTCGLDDRSALSCWGNGIDISNISTASRFKQITAAGGKLCALDTNNDIECWTSNGSQGSASFTAILTAYPGAILTDLVESGSALCAMFDLDADPAVSNFVACISTPGNPLDNFIRTGSITALAASGDTLCWASDNGAVLCGNANLVPDTSIFEGLTPTVAALDMEGNKICALLVDGSVVCSDDVNPPVGGRQTTPP